MTHVKNLENSSNNFTLFGEQMRVMSATHCLHVLQSEYMMFKSADA